MTLLEDELVWLERNFPLPNSHIDNMTPCLDSIAGSVQTCLQPSTVEHNIGSTSSTQFSDLCNNIIRLWVQNLMSPEVSGKLLPPRGHFGEDYLVQALCDKALDHCQSYWSATQHKNRMLRSKRWCCRDSMPGYGQNLNESSNIERDVFWKMKHCVLGNADSVAETSSPTT